MKLKLSDTGEDRSPELAKKLHAATERKMAETGLNYTDAFKEVIKNAPIAARLYSEGRDVAKLKKQQTPARVARLETRNEIARRMTDLVIAAQREEVAAGVDEKKRKDFGWMHRHLINSDRDYARLAEMWDNIKLPSGRVKKS